MTHTLKSGALAFLVIGAALGACNGQPQSSTDIVGVATVIDGDTIDIHGDRIRLSGIDAPERGRRCEGGSINAYQRASLALSDVIGHATVRCAVTGQDRYGRAVATCRVGGADIADRMVEDGWARDWPRYSHGAYAASEERARDAQKGLWAMDCPDLWGDRDYSR